MVAMNLPPSLASRLPNLRSRSTWTMFAVFLISTLLIYSAYSMRIVMKEQANIQSLYHNTPHPLDMNGTAVEPTWLIATMTPAHSLQRRAIIRATWQKLYRDDSLFRTVFVISRPDPGWMPLIAAEIAAHGDIVVLPHLEENSFVANHVKSIEFFKWLATQGKEWEFVSKIDDDSFLDPFAMYKEFLQPLSIKMREENNYRYMVARRLKWPNGGFKFPGGQFYTMTWEMLKLVTRLFEEDPMEEFEDVLLGRLLHESSEMWDLVTLESRVAFDYDDDAESLEINGIKTAWAKPWDDLDAWTHGVGPGAINPHKMKTDSAYLRVAACFGPDGLLQNKEDALKQLTV
ncbi:hypothetical protein GQ53DRAFT_348432 [Thozetella sp. PMI_491]|nr:hypothetical protein GQ53DRAFT_348432 [Thozetella sp. PMI_491]